MKNQDYLCTKIAYVMQTGCFYMDSFASLRSFAHDENNPLFVNETLRHTLMALADHQQEPVLYKDGFELYFICLRDEEGYWMFGPVTQMHMNKTQIRRYQRFYNVPANARAAAEMDFHTLLAYVEILGKICMDREFSVQDILKANAGDKEEKEETDKEKWLFSMNKSEEELYHHTYREEKKIVEAVKAGNGREAIRLSMEMDHEVGHLSRQDLNHWKNVVIAAITVATRAAIDAGLSPAAAYDLSDFYIQKSDICQRKESLFEYRNMAVFDLSEEVRKMLERKNRASYARQCELYIESHYREKIYVEDIAAKLGLSPTYLSRYYKQETGIGLQDYVNKVRIEHAANLLKYSEESMVEIAAYVNFSSQSYFGKVFKKLMHMTPVEYRRMYKTVEFTQK